MWHDTRLLNACTHTLISTLMFIWLGIALIKLMHHPLFLLKEVHISCLDNLDDLSTIVNNNSAKKKLPRYVNVPAIRHTVLPAFVYQSQKNFFTIDLFHITQAFESVPWVRRAHVSRVWPNRLHVMIEEYQPLAILEKGQLLSTKGDIFTANLDKAEKNSALIKVTGPPGSEYTIFARIHDLQQWLSPLKLKLASLVLSSRYAWTMTLDNGMTVNLGREDNGLGATSNSDDIFRQRVTRFVQAYPQLQAYWPEGFINIDMRYPNGLATQLKKLKSQDQYREMKKS